MRIGIFSLRNHLYHPNMRLLEAARGLGHEAFLLHPKRMFLSLNNKAGLRPLSGGFRADLVMPRIGATIREFPLSVIRQLVLLGIPLVNSYESVVGASNKWHVLQSLFFHGIAMPESRYISNLRNFKKAVSDLGGYPLVMKRTQGRQGKGVFLVESHEQALRHLEGYLGTGQGTLIQRYIPPRRRRDYRLLVVGGAVIGAMALSPRKGDFRANVHQKARAEAFRPTEEIASLAVMAARALGLDISGVDMIEEEGGRLLVVDVNYSPGFKGLEQATGIDAAAAIIRYVTDPVRSPLRETPVRPQE